MLWRQGGGAFCFLAELLHQSNGILLTTSTVTLFVYQPLRCHSFKDAAFPLSALNLIYG